MKKHPKVILLGQSNVGKTSIIQVLLHGNFNSKMENTLGACFHRYQSTDARGETFVIDIWDTAGQERFRSLLTLYYKNSDAVIIVFDLTVPDSFRTVDFWAKQIEANCETSPSIILVGNKMDLKEVGHGVSRQEINKYLSTHKKWEYMQCSARQNVNVKNIFQKVSVLLREQEREKQKSVQNSKMKIHPSKLRKTKERGSCC